MNVKDLKTLTPDQLLAVEKVVAEFNKVNAPKQIIGGLINVSLIKENDIKKYEDIERIRVSDNAYIQLIHDTIIGDCEALNVDLFQLGLKAFYHKSMSQRLVIAPINFEELNLTRSWYLIYEYCNKYTNKNFCEKDEISGFIRTKSNYTFDSLKGLVQSIEFNQAITSMYEKYGKELIK